MPTTCTKGLKFGIYLASDEHAFNGTGAWTTWQITSITTPLNAGANMIRATATTANGGPNLDYLEVELVPPPSS